MLNPGQKWFAAETWKLDRTTWKIIIACFVSIFVFVTTSWLALGAFGLLVLAIFTGSNDLHQVLNVKTTWWRNFGATLAVYCICSGAWSADPRASIQTGLIIAALVFGLHVMEVGIATLNTKALGHVTRALLAGYTVALLYLFVEEMFNHSIIYFLKSMPAMVIANKKPLVIMSHVSNWSMPPLIFVLWPVLLILQIQLRGALGRILCVTLLVLTLVTVFRSSHETSQLSLSVGLLVFALCFMVPRTTYFLLTVGWIMAFVVIIPTALALFHYNFHSDDRIMSTARARIVIWDFTAKRVKDHPFLGVGAASTKRLDHEQFDAHPKYTIEGYGLRLGAHAHSIFLQSWFELGAVGVGMLLMLGLSALELLRHAPPRALPYLTATFATVAAVSASSFGLFEPWFMSAIAMTAVNSVLASTYLAKCEVQLLAAGPVPATG